LTGPILSIVSFVSVVNGVDTSTQTSPDESCTAVERPPIGIHPKRANGLAVTFSYRLRASISKLTAKTHLENVQTPLVTYFEKRSATSWLKVLEGPFTINSYFTDDHFRGGHDCLRRKEILRERSCCSQLALSMTHANRASYIQQLK
jgi:hypothetical protein